MSKYLGFDDEILTNRQTLRIRSYRSIRNVTAGTSAQHFATDTVCSRQSINRT